MPARKVIATAWALVTHHPREAMLPLVVIQIPVAILTGAVLAVLLLTVFGDQEINTNDGGQLLALLLVSGTQALFAQVARGSTIVSLAGVIRGQPLTLTQALDPAVRGESPNRVAAYFFRNPTAYGTHRDAHHRLVGEGHCGVVFGLCTRYQVTAALLRRCKDVLSLPGRYLQAVDVLSKSVRFCHGGCPVWAC